MKPRAAHVVGETCCTLKVFANRAAQGQPPEAITRGARGYGLAIAEIARQAISTCGVSLEDIQRRRVPQTIRIELATANSTMLWHEFVGWQSSHSFRFSGGLSGKQVQFVFNPATGDVQAQAAVAGSFRAIIKSGAAEVKPSSH